MRVATVSRKSFQRYEELLGERYNSLLGGEKRDKKYEAYIRWKWRRLLSMAKDDHKKTQCGMNLQMESSQNRQTVL